MLHTKKSDFIKNNFNKKIFTLFFFFIVISSMFHQKINKTKVYEIKEDQCFFFERGKIINDETRFFYKEDFFLSLKTEMDKNQIKFKVFYNNFFYKKNLFAINFDEKNNDLWVIGLSILEKKYKEFCKNGKIIITDFK